MLKIVYNKIGDNMSSKLLKEYEGKLILLYGGPNKSIEETLEVLFQSSSDNWSKDYVKLIHALKQIKVWYQKLEKLNFLTLSTFLKFYQLFQKDMYEKHDKHVLKHLNLDPNKKLKNMSEAEKERIYFLLLYQLDLNIYVFEMSFLLSLAGAHILPMTARCIPWVSFRVAVRLKPAAMSMSQTSLAWPSPTSKSR